MLKSSFRVYMLGKFYCRLELVVKNKAPNALIVCEEMVLVMIRLILWSLVYINFHLLC